MRGGRETRTEVGGLRTGRETQDSRQWARESGNGYSGIFGQGALFHRRFFALIFALDSFAPSRITDANDAIWLVTGKVNGCQLNRYHH